MAMTNDQSFIVEAILEERARQDEKWGEQNHHPLFWLSIAGEEFGEMCRAYNEYSFDNCHQHFEHLKKETVHLMAVCMASLECYARVERGDMEPDPKRSGRA